MAASPDNLIVGLDVGSSKIAMIAAERDADGNLSYVNGSYRLSYGVHNGIVVDIADAAACIEGALSDLEERVGRRITTACVAVAGPHVQGHRTRGTMAPMGRDITDEDVARAIGDARAALALPENREIIHEIPRAYIVDGQPGVHDPHGMAGYELEVEVAYATGVSTTISNLAKCTSQARLTPDMLVAAPLAAAEAVRPRDERMGCVAVVDLGAETLSLAIYADGAVWSSAVLPVGGADITRDIASQLKLPWPAAEDLKLRYGQCAPGADEYELVEMPASSGFEGFVPRAALTAIIRKRGEALAQSVAQQLHAVRDAGLDPETLILTGGGADLLGLDDLLVRACEVPVSRGVPRGIRGLPSGLERPIFATAAGLVHWYAHYAPYGDGAASGRRFAPLPGFVAGMKKLFRVVLP
ncbi:MAG: cell division protein FtsA [Ktedonobacterales bacterium]